VPNPKYPRNPARILTNAFKMGMAITLALARDRAAGKTKPLYFGQGNRIKGIAAIWKERKENYQQTVQKGYPNASELLKAENSIRRSFCRILLKTSVRYGNTETKRVKREEGSKKYLNNLWDYSGSRIRDVVKVRHIFPKPIQIDLLNGSFVYGYHGSTKTPFYPVRHNHLPELDFGDMIRSPLMELGRQCLKYGVPINEAKKHIDALLFRLIPFLDYIYTERKSGRSNYVRDGLKELRIAVDQIKRKYGTRNGQRPSITIEAQESVFGDTPTEPCQDQEDIDSPYEEEQDDEKWTHILEEAVKIARAEELVMGEYLTKAEELLSSHILSIDDSIEFLKQLTEERRKVGVKVHNFVCKNFQSPFSFNGVVYHGREMAYDDSGLLLFSEVPVDGGRGRIDFVLARARQLTRVDGAPAPIICEPFMLVELKTKSAFDFDIYGVESRSNIENSIVSEFLFDWRALTDKEWEYVLANTPDDYECEQLSAYEQAALVDYQRVMWRDNDVQRSLSKAVIVVDAHQDWRNIQQAILPLIMHAYDGCLDGTLSGGDLLIPSEGDKQLRIAMRMLSVVKPTSDTVSLSPPLPLEFSSQPIEDQKEFILYLTVPGRGSSAQSAAAIAERWHGLEYIHSITRRQHRDVFWFDLTGEYSDPVLRKKQFRLCYQDNSVRRFFNRRVKIRDLSELIRQCVYEGKPLRTIRTSIRGQLKSSRRAFVVVSGWESLRRSTPTSNQEYLNEIATAIIQAIPSGSAIVWFARPVPLAQNDVSYGMRCVAPFYQGTLWQTYTDTVVWNVALPPDRHGAFVPTNDHERAIFIEKAGRLTHSKIIKIEPLRGWSEDFRAGGRKSRPVFHRGVGLTPQQGESHNEEQLEQVLRLIPHLRSSTEYNMVPQSNFTLAIEEVSSEYSKTQDHQAMVSFRPTQIYTSTKNISNLEEEIDGRYRILLPMESINRKREYREMELGVAPQQRSTRPPSEALLSVTEIDDQRIIYTEMRHLRNTIRFLKYENKGNLREMLCQLSEVLEVPDERDAENATLLMNRLRLVRQILETSPLSKTMWERLLPIRSAFPRELSLAQRNHIASLQIRHPDLLLLTGNHLFLLILAAMGSTPEIVFPASLAASWKYVQPWHMMGLGLRPIYPSEHTSGRSVLDRHKILKRLKRRIIDCNRSLDLQALPTNIRFGQLIVPPSSGATDSIYLWLIFQRAPGVYDMNAALMKPRGVDPSLSPIDVLLEMVSERSYWSESDLSLLSWYANIQGNETKIPVMIGNLQGLRILWISDRERQRWIPVGRIHYTTRRFEDVTLIRTVTISRESHLQQIRHADVRTPIHRIEDMVSTALFILNKGLEGCTLAKCKVSLDTEKKCYKVAFLEQKNGEFLGEFLVSRTTDLLEILRRPDDVCEPVLVNGKQVIWNRFRDVIYDKTGFLKPWVDRHRPFTGLSLGTPTTARDLFEASKDFDFKLEIYHDPWTCPLRHLSLEDIKKSLHRAQALGHHYLLRYETHWSEPERISNEPGIHHGSCWRIYIDTPISLPPELSELIQIRFTDAQIRSLVSSQEIVYWSRSRQEWVTHSFGVVLRKQCIEEAKESWHLRLMLKELTGQKLNANLPGMYVANPDRWSPFFNIESEYVVVGLKEKDTGLVEEQVIHERNVALRTSSEVHDLLERAIMNFRKKKGIRADRRLAADIQREISDTIEIHEIHEDRATARLDRVSIEQDSVGGKRIYVFLDSQNEAHRIPVTGHLHDIRQFGRISKDAFVEEVMQILNEFNISDEDKLEATRQSVRLMKNESLIGR
jgi:hypothetical protein